MQGHRFGCFGLDVFVRFDAKGSLFRLVRSLKPRPIVAKTACAPQGNQRKSFKQRFELETRVGNPR